MVLHVHTILVSRYLNDDSIFLRRFDVYYCACFGFQDGLLDYYSFVFFFFSSRRRHTRYIGDWSSDVCSSDLFALIDSGRTHDRVSVAVALVVEGNAVVGAPGIDQCETRVVEEEAVAGGREEEREIGRASCRERGESAGGWERLGERQTRDHAD